MAFSSQYGVLDGAQPVNWQSPLMKGLATWVHFGLIQHYAATDGHRIPGLTRRPTGSMEGRTSAGISQFRGATNPGIRGALRFDATAKGPILPATTFGTMDTLFTNPTACTIIVLYRKRDTTARASYVFGVDPLPNGDDRELSAHVPFSDGTTYWSFGGWTTGTNRLTASWTPDTDWHYWAFVVGDGQGMRIYLDGNLLASNAATPTRSVADGANFYLGFGTFASSDSANLAEFIAFNRGLSQHEIRQWMRQSRAGHPDTLNWRRPNKGLVYAGATSPPPPPPPPPAATPAISVIGPAWAEIVDVWAATTVRPMEVPGPTLPTLPPVPLPQAGTAGKALIPTDALASPSTREAIDRIREPLNSLMSDGRLVRFDVTNRKWTLTTGFTASRAPTATDDITMGALPGMTWVNTSATTVYICASNATGAAVWLKLATE